MGRSNQIQEFSGSWKAIGQLRFSWWIVAQLVSWNYLLSIYQYYIFFRQFYYFSFKESLRSLFHFHPFIFLLDFVSFRFAAQEDHLLVHSSITSISQPIESHIHKKIQIRVAFLSFHLKHELTACPVWHSLLLLLIL